jgi:hypothetical protein
MTETLNYKKRCFFLYFELFFSLLSRTGKKKKKKIMNDEDEPTNGEQNKEETENFFSRASELHAMFEESLAMCFEPATVGVRFAFLF